MDGVSIKEAIKSLSERVIATRDRIQTEEATKNAYIMPFLQILGYDIFNPIEVVPEFTADVGIKKGEKVDYAICRNDLPVILIECKSCAADLCVDNESQLFRYFHTTKAKFGILTNGIAYKFFTDLEEPNKMDSSPFMEINILDHEKINYKELAKFSKAEFDTDNIRRTADILKCANSIKAVLDAEFTDPSEDFVRVIFKKMVCSCSGSMFTEKVKEKLTPLVKSAIDTMIKDKVKANLDSALRSTVKAQEAAVQEAIPADDDDGPITTQDETDAFNIIRAILREELSPDRVAIRDAKSYCAILCDDNNRRPLCRLFFNNPEKKTIVLFDGDGEDRIAITDLNDIFKFSDRLKATAKKYIALG
jgi:hypothetical protein